ncbi:hypothetical protein LV84_02930 [Algoriphagus ratkowskyi]|uniref:Uncharacterized protein n=1 Tax=Algoriphagus ratkowskyi TaxID=57028 RepID=A0A2W7ST12_9BACT|nr:hypothetical protein [Algoriphagus ratkowskyi]PZX53822.1 hypothetical protein LV84_02930 [Algoriphagus ratkowskyi]TXD76773.1 hypothetical protein ESW18_15530 [Algoriphagus ratkowskyi]
MKKLVSFLAMIIFFSLVSCKAYRNPVNLKPKYIIESPELSDKMPGLQNLLVGDEIKVVGKDQRILYLNYSGIDSDLVLGEMWKENGKKMRDEKTVKIPLSEIDFINVKRNSPGATIALVAGLGTVATVSFIALAISILVEHTGPDNWK